MKKILFSATDSDQHNIALIMALYPNPANMTDAIRHALREYVHNADPVKLEQARKTVARARREATK